ncbi:hypothetical protein B0T10DRAFT_527372 [Thelonectria olida]|uniref:Uncharacterized protein n=1 Tax=Thelonectria olida TaxID=1576542 RepID=A0A9P9AT83_9HYPO|nr:hypothetical protein B0T10DRAFT_527372 [Thelonectria olida]
MSTSREGFTFDLVGRITWETLLNPVVIIPIVFGIHCGPFNGFTLTDWSPVLGRIRIILYVSGVCGIFLRVIDLFNRRYNNNWTKNSDWEWQKEIVVITGGSSGIGASLAQQLLSRNAHTKIVIIDYMPLTWEPAKMLHVHFYQCDLSDSSQIRTTCEIIRQEVGQPTVLINNAGICRGFTVCEGSYADVEVTIRTNLIAPFLLIKEFLPSMVQSNHGHIVNISSMSALLPPSKVADYAATKAGLIALHEALQLELKYAHKAPRVRLSLAIFSFIRTPLFDGETNQSQFWFPLLDVETVSETLAETLYGGYGKTIYMPGIMRYVAIMKGGPEWMWRVIREETRNLGVNFRGRQKLNPKTGGLTASEV